eukprot:COSAG01_NODE_57911_length_309_cov_0.976190_1_plen_86_part_01
MLLVRTDGGCAKSEWDAWCKRYHRLETAHRKLVSRSLPSWKRPVLTEISLLHACACHDMLDRVETAVRHNRGGRTSSCSASSPARR